MRLSDMVIPNEDFQTSINIDFDFGSKEKIEGLIPTDSVCRYLEEILRDVVTDSNQRAKLLVGAYGKGKSHVVLAALTAMWTKDPSCFERIIAAYEERDLAFGETLKSLVTNGKQLLPVIISGSTSDLRHSLLYGLRSALQFAELDELMPTTNYDGAIRVLDRWKNEYPDTLQRFAELTGNSAVSIVSRLKNMDTDAYALFTEAYPKLTSGGSFDALDGAEVLAVYDNVLGELAQYGISGIYVVYDEFSKYLETSLDRATFEDTKLLQDFAEACNRSSNDHQLHLLLISHKSLANYIDSNLPKEKVDGWRGVSGRFREIEMADDPNQYYELLSNAIIKDDEQWDAWLKADNGDNEIALREMAQRYVARKLYDEGIADVVAFGCWPLHPVTSYLLARMSEKVAQNERTLFTFICSRERNSFSDALSGGDELVAPDHVYAYFEPLLKREFYASPLHKTYELVRSSLRRVGRDSLESRIIRTIAAIDIVAQYDRVAPTKATLLELYTDCGCDRAEVEAAIEAIVASDSVVYLRRSDSFLKLKETSGVRIDNEVSDKAEKLRHASEPVDILNAAMRGKALYPSRYNEERGIVRYFDCGFASLKTLSEWESGVSVLHGTGDGEIIAAYADTPDDMDKLVSLAQEVSTEPMTVVIVPRRFTDISDALYRLEAAQHLKKEAAGDDVLIEEYGIVSDDSRIIVDEYVAAFLQPELGRSMYFIGGQVHNGVTRKRLLSEELSKLCDIAYQNTPRITSEALNKNELTGTAFGSRAKILRALCAKDLQPNFGFIGNGQEVSMARSAFEMTGVIKNIAAAIDQPGDTREPGMDLVLDTIRDFVVKAQDSPISDLYDLLMGPELGIGMRMGPIPLYLAYVLREYRDEVRIAFDGKERTLSEELLADVGNFPAPYTLTRLNWSPDMARFVSRLATLYECDESADRNAVVDAMRQWYVSLPQVTRNSRFDHTCEGEKVPYPSLHTCFFDVIRRPDNDSNKLLFKDLSGVFGKDLDYDGLADAIEKEKRVCDSYLSDTVERLAIDIKSLFGANASKDASLYSVFQDWLEDNPVTETRVFTGVSNQVVSAIRSLSRGDHAIVNKLARAATSLRIEDWNDARFADFMHILRTAKSEVEGMSARDGDEAEEKTATITFVGSDGTQKQKTFDIVVASRRSKLLKNNILACLDEMGGALKPEEKRQVVFKILKGLC